MRAAPVHARAFAKINLTLRVLGRRRDGYHELRTVFQSVALHDLLTFERHPGRFELVCDDPRCPVDERNLVWRAAALVWEAAGRAGELRGVRVSIRKRIPLQAGLGGGSSDAAATLRVLTAAWCPRLSKGTLTAMAASLGADVPFFLRGGTVLGVERGDRLFPLQDRERSWVVLAQPPFGVSTADAYRWYDESSPVDGLSPARPEHAGGIAPYDDGGNDLQAPVAARHRAIATIVGRLRRHGAFWSAMSGSGSVCFGLFERRSAAAAAARMLATSRLTTTVTRLQTAAEFALGSAPFSARRRR